MRTPRHSRRPARMAIFAEPRNEASGRVSGPAVVTPCAFAAIEQSGQQPQNVLARPVNRDWGELVAHDRKDNEISLELGFRF